MSTHTDYTDAPQVSGYQNPGTYLALHEDAVPKVGERNQTFQANQSQPASSLPAELQIVGDQSANATVGTTSDASKTTSTEHGWEITKSGEQPTKLVKGDTTIDLPAGASNLEFKDGLPSYTKNGVAVDLGEDGKPKAYHSNGFSFEHHDSDDTWYYHEDKGGDYVKIDIPTLNEDGSVKTKENGGFNSGREHSLNASGQSTEGIVSKTLGRMGDQLEIDKLTEAIKNGSGSDVLAWGKKNIGVTGGLGLPSLLLDGIAGTNTFSTVNAFTKGFGDSLVDGMVNGVVYAAGLAQGGAENLGIMPDLKQIDQVIPKLDIYEDFDPANASTSETIAARIGQVGGYLVPFAGTAGAVVKGTKGAIAAAQEGRVISSLTDNVAELGGTVKSWFSGAAKHSDEGIPPRNPMNVSEYDGLANLGGMDIPAAAREVQIGDDIFRLTKRNPIQKWIYGGLGHGEKSPVKLHVTTDGPEDLARLQEVLIPALKRDPELRRMVGDWKTFDPLHGIQPSRAVGSAPDGIENGAKGFTIYPANVDDVPKIQARLDALLHKNGLGRDVPINTGNVDEIAGMSNRVGAVRDLFQPAMVNGQASGARLPEGLTAKIQGLHGRPSPQDLRAIEESAGLHPGILHYDDAGHLSIAGTSRNSNLNSDGMFYLTESGANTSTALTDRPAIYALARKFGFNLA